MSISFSVITATFNCADTLEQCLNSVRVQTHLLREHIIIDGLSTIDDTLSILNSRKSEFSVLVSEPDRGIYDALNKGISRASGDVVGFLHSDDFYANADVLSRVAHEFLDPSVCAVYGDLHYVRRNDAAEVVRFWRAGEYRPGMLRRGWMPPHPSLFVRRHLLSSVGFFDLRFRISADYLSVLRMFRSPDFRSVYIPEVLVKMRVGGASNRSLGNIVRKSFEDYSALRVSGFGVLGSCAALLCKNLSKVNQFLVAGES